MRGNRDNEKKANEKEEEKKKEREERLRMKIEKLKEFGIMKDKIEGRRIS